MVSLSLAKERLKEAVDLLSSMTAVAILYTLAFILYCLSLRLACAQIRDDNGKIKPQTVYTFVFQTVLLICATMDVIFKNHSVQVRFIDNSTLSGGPLGIPATLSAETLSNLVDVTSAVENFLVLGVLLWRVRVIWSGTRFVIPLIIVSSFIYLVNAGLVLSVNVIVWNAKNPKLAAIPGQAIIFIMASVSSSASLLLMASIIIARLLFIRQKHIRLLGRTDVAGQYLSIAAMLIESYALDSLWNIATIVSFGLKNAPTTSFFNDCVIQVDILTNFLLTYRVLCGRAWTRQTEDRLSTLRWTSNGAGTTTETIDPRQTRVPEGDPPMTDSRNDTYQS